MLSNKPGRKRATPTGRKRATPTETAFDSPILICHFADAIRD